MIRKLISMIKKAKKFLNPKRVFKKTEKVEERVYAFTITDEEGNPKEVINVKESELTLDQMNFLYMRFVENYNALPEKVRLSFAQYYQSLNAQAKRVEAKEVKEEK